MIKKIIIVISIPLILYYGGFLIKFGWHQIFYESELKEIRDQLNSIEGVKVINIWGHKDLTLEEIAARVRIEGKGELVLCNLSDDVFKYPNEVLISGIGGISFKKYYCNGRLSIGRNLDIGRKGALHTLLRMNFHSPKEVIDNYDKIYDVIKTLPMFPELRHFKTKDSSEEFIGIVSNQTEDQDKLLMLMGIEEEFKFAKKLHWTDKKCND